MLEALALSLSIMAHIMAMSFVTTLAVQVAGVAAPLGFLIGMTAMMIVVSSVDEEHIQKSLELAADPGVRILEPR
jgi:hypothetical protein